MRDLSTNFQVSIWGRLTKGEIKYVKDKASLRSPRSHCIKAHTTQSRLECGAASGFDCLAAHKRGSPPHYTLSENDLAIIRRKRGPHNRLGFAVQLCYLRFPGQAMTLEAEPSAEMLAHVAQQVDVNPNAWTEYAARDETRREHAFELQSVFGYRSFTIAEYRKVRGWLTDLALQTNKALALAEELIELLRSRRIIVPAITMIDRLCAEALARGVKLLYKRLTQSLDDHCSTKLDALLLPREGLRTVVITWLRQPPGEPKAKMYLGISIGCIEFAR